MGGWQGFLLTCCGGGLDNRRGMYDVCMMSIGCCK